MEEIIPSLIATEVSAEPLLADGTTKPLQLECASILNIEKRDTYVVKLREEITIKGLISEIFGSLLAQHFGLNTPEPAIIEITESFADAASLNFDHNDIYGLINRNKGLNFGSKFIKETLEIPMQVPGELITKAAEIIAFDALIWNADRTKMVPNLFQCGDEYYVFDHEKAFLFLYQDEDIPVWRCITPTGDSIIQNHLFYLDVKGKEFDLTTFKNRLDNLSDDRIIGICRQIPGRIRDDKIQNSIMDYLKKARNNSREIFFNLLKVLR